MLWYQIKSINKNNIYGLQLISGNSFAVLYYKCNTGTKIFIKTSLDLMYLSKFFDIVPIESIFHRINNFKYSLYGLSKRKNETYDIFIKIFDINSIISELKINDGIMFWFYTDKRIKSRFIKIFNNKVYRVKIILLSNNKKELKKGKFNLKGIDNIRNIMQRNLDFTIKWKPISGIKEVKKIIENYGSRHTGIFSFKKLLFTNINVINSFLYTETNKNNETAGNTKTNENTVFYNTNVNSKIFALSTYKGNALLSGNADKTQIILNIIKYANDNKRNTYMLMASKEKEFLKSINMDIINIFELSSGYFKQRIIKSTSQAIELAENLYKEITKNIKGENNIFIIYKSGDIIPVTKNGRNYVFENEFWRIFFNLINSNIKNNLFLFVCSDNICDTLTNYVDIIIKTDDVNNNIDIDITNNKNTFKNAERGI